MKKAGNKGRRGEGESVRRQGRRGRREGGKEAGSVLRP